MLKFLLIYFFLILAHLPLFGQYNFLSYSVDQGLSHVNVSCISEDQWGRVYFGTQGGGISRFNGKEFTRLNRLDGLPSDFVQSLLLDSLGRIWIGTQNGLAVLEDDLCTSIISPSGVEPNILSLAYYQNQIYIGTSQGLQHYDIGEQLLKPIWLDKLFGIRINTLLVKSERIFIGTSEGLFRLSPEPGLPSLDHIPGTAHMAISALHDLGHQGLAVGTANRGLYIFDRNQFSIKIDSLPVTFIHSIGDTVWIGTRDQGLTRYRLSDGWRETINTERGMITNRISCIYRDSWKNIWIGTQGSGTAKFLGKQFVLYDQLPGLKEPSVDALLIAQNQIWAGSNTGGLATSNLDSIHWLTDPEYATKRIQSIFRDQHGLVWLGSDRGLFLSYKDTLIYHGLETGLSSIHISSMVIDSSETIWIGTQGGGICTIEKLDTLDYSIIPFLTGEAWSNTTISDFHVDHRNRTWFCTTDGRIGYFDLTGLQAIFSVPHDLPPIAFHALAEDALGRLIIASEGEGLFYTSLYADSIHFSTMERSLFRSLNMYSLLADRNGLIWTATEEGVYHFAMDAKGSPKNFKHFSRKEGFITGQSLADAAVEDHLGNLWFGTRSGLIKHTPSSSSITNPPRIRLSRVMLFDSVLDQPSEPHSFSSVENNFSFEFEGFHLNHPDEIQYSWRLNGLHDSWTSLNRSQFVNFPKLSSGKYIFEVKSCIHPKFCSEPAQYAVSIAKPFWKSWWFIVLVISTLSLAIFSLYKRRIAAILERQRKAEMEKQLAILEQKALQLQMNPHFLFNALNSIQGLIVTGDQDQARAQIGRFAKLMRATLNNSREDLISLDQEIQTLRWYIEMEQFCRGNSFSYTLNYGDEMDLEAIMIPPMVIQPFVENAIIHGLAGIDYPGELKLSFSQHKDKLMVSVIDNGKGITRRTEVDSSPKNAHRSVGLAVTQQRLKMMTDGSRSGQVYITPLNQKSGRGTRVDIEIPLLSS